MASTRHLTLLTVLILAGMASLAAWRLEAMSQVNAPLAPASAPGQISYQGTLADDVGEPISGTVTLKFEIYDALSGGTLLWDETQGDIAVNNGYFATLLGSNTPLDATVFADTSRFLQVSVDDGAGFIDLPRQQFAAVPYAFHADQATTAGSALTATTATTATVATTALSASWSNLTDVPGGFVDGIDDNTTYTAGDGLSLNGSQFNVVAVPQGHFRDMIVDGVGNVGTYSSIIIGIDGLPLISYYDASNGDLKVLHCKDMLCTSSTQTTLDSQGVVGKYSSITIGRDGYGLISYYDDTNGDLKLASCQNVACTSASLTTVDSGGDVGQYTSITPNDSGYGFIGYYDAGNDDLKVVSCSNLPCTSSTIWTVDSGGDVGQYLSVTRNGNDYAYISYYDATNGNLKVARCFNVSCGSPTINTVDGTGTSGGAEDDVGLYTSITIGSDGYPLIAYAKRNQPNFSSAQVKVAHCTNSLCSTADIDPVISAVGIDWQGIAITLGRDGLGLISTTFSNTSRVYVFHCNNVACSEQTISDSTVLTGAVDSSLTIGIDGLPILSYASDVGDDLHVVHCSDNMCAPYRRLR